LPCFADLDLANPFALTTDGFGTFDLGGNTLHDFVLDYYSGGANHVYLDIKVRAILETAHRISIVVAINREALCRAHAAVQWSGHPISQIIILIR
jgi:hypothetical protein